jgi:hypothetical protein
MELKDLTRPLFVIGMEKLNVEFTKENIEKFENNETGFIIIRGTNEHGEWRDYINYTDDIQEELLSCFDVVEDLVDEGYSEISVLYSTYYNSFNLNWDDFPENDYEDFFLTGLEVLCGVEDREYYLNSENDVDIFYFDSTGDEQVFTLSYDEYSTFMEDEDEVIEMVKREIESKK